MARVLCVEGEHPAVTHEYGVLETAGYTMTTANSVRDAVEKLRTGVYDAVVMGWKLCDGDGLAVIREARKSNGEMPVVVVTAFLADAYHAPEPDADLYLKRPVDPQELVLIVNELLKRTGTAIQDR